MSDLITEVDEAMKQERLEALWQKYGGFVIGFLVVVILGTAANEGYKSWTKAQNIEQTNIYLDAIENKDATPDSILNAANKLNSGPKGLAQMHAAGLAIEKGDQQTAIAIYKDMEAGKDSDPTTIYIAKYMVTNLDDSLSAEEKRTRYENLSDDNNNPWRFNARFELALLEAHSFKNFKSARKHLDVILNENAVAKTLKQKAKSLDILYAAKETTASE